MSNNTFAIPEACWHYSCYPWLFGLYAALKSGAPTPDNVDWKHLPSFEMFERLLSARSLEDVCRQLANTLVQELWANPGELHPAGSGYAKLVEEVYGEPPDVAYGLYTLYLYAVANGDTPPPTGPAEFPKAVATWYEGARQNGKGLVLAKSPEGKAVIDLVVDALPALLRPYVVHRFGLAGTGEITRFKDVGTRLGRSGGRANSAVQSAVRIFRHPSRAIYLHRVVV